ncbi:hypothetical protein PLESTM_001742900 [Pleodorina starrii]|nr:hypothetical protein PLESTM_001742900 [Pleodorina starrii]
MLPFISLDDPTDISNTSFMCIHVYYVDGWSRQVVFIELLAQIDLLLGPGRMLATCLSTLLLLSTLCSRLHPTADQLAQQVVGIIGADGAGVTMGECTGAIRGLTDGWANQPLLPL